MSQKVINAGFPKNTMTPEDFFRQLGIKPMAPEVVEREAREQENETFKKLTKAISQGDANQVRQVLSSNAHLLRLSYCGGSSNLFSEARLIGRMPIRGNSALIIGMDQTMPLAFLLSARHGCEVTCLTNYHKIGSQWAQANGWTRLKFADISLKGYFDQGGRFDAAVFGSGWGAILDPGFAEKVIVPGRNGWLPTNGSNLPEAYLLTAFELFDKAIAQAGILIIQTYVSPFELGLLANDRDLYGVFPHWKLVSTIQLPNEEGNPGAMIFSRLDSTQFVENDFREWADKGEISTGRTYYGESALLFREVFQDVPPISTINIEWQENHVQTLVDFFQKNEVALIFKTSSAGGRIAYPVTPTQLTDEMKLSQDFVRLREEEGKLKIKR